MHIKAIWRLALIIAACFWIGQTTSTTAQAQGAEAHSSAQSPGAPIVLKKYTKRHSRHARRASARSRKKVAQTKPLADNRTAKDKTTTEAKTMDATVAAPMAPDLLAGSTAATLAGERTLSPSIANARAQLEGDTTISPPPTPDAPAMNPAPTVAVTDATASPPIAGSGNSGPVEPATPSTAAANDTAHATAAQPPTQTPGHAAPSPTPRSAATTTEGQTEASATGSDTWSRTSLIGKIFVAFGGLLTLASAARLFIA